MEYRCPFVAICPSHFDRSVSLGRRRRYESNPEVRSKRTLLVRLGRTGRTAGPIQWSTFHHHRSGRKSVPRRGIQWASAEISTEARRRSCENRRTGIAVLVIEELGTLKGRFK